MSMDDAFIGEIRIFAGPYAPDGWAVCDGRLMSIAENQDLYNVIFTYYGGDGVTTFALPDLRGRAPMLAAPPNRLTSQGGTPTKTLTADVMPYHNHNMQALLVDATDSIPVNGQSMLAQARATTGPIPSRGRNAYAPGAGNPIDLMNPALLSQPAPAPVSTLDNHQPYLVSNFIISVYAGIFPQRG